MKVYESIDIRNVGIAGHGNSGKTSLVAGMLFAAGATQRLGRVDDGTTLTDFDEEEISRKVTIATAVAALEWKRLKFNLLDTPGFNIFINDTKGALVAADAALIVVDGIAGVEVQTEKVADFAEGFQIPRAFVINKLDRERSSFERTVQSIQTHFGRAAVPIHLAIGAEKDFKGIVDLIRMKAFTYVPDGDGKGKESEIPAELSEASIAAHEALIEMVAEGNDALLEEFFDSGTLAPDHLLAGLRLAVAERRISPILCASALHNIGTDLILNFIGEYLPNPTERGKVKGKWGDRELERAVKDSEPVSLFVFKTVADLFSGRVSYFKVMSGVIRNDANLHNVRSGSSERLAHLSVLKGKTLDPVTELHAGDIGAVAKLKETITSDTLCDKPCPVAYPAVDIPEPSIAYAVTAKTRQDEDRMGQAIHRILEEDAALRFYRDPQTKEFLVAGTGQQHVEVVVNKLKKRYGVDVSLHSPKIPYRETIRGFADVQGRHKKQTGGHGQFGDCKVKVEPLPRGARFEFVNAIFGGAIPKTFIPAIEKGILEASEKGYLAGYPMVDFRVTLYDGSYHDVDSSEMSFKLAGRKAFKAAMAVAKPALLEPVMKVEVQAPVEFAGDLMGDMNGRRGRIAGMDTKGGTQIIRAMVPMSEMLTYQNDLISMTQGRASFSMEFDHYDFVPPPQAEKIIAAARAAKSGDEEEEE
ncbi:MAG TPA: elongation factor G [Bryobacteraceae bacterium]|nr:elongation factor G [Bryobacteraceae bacterium]